MPDNSFILFTLGPVQGFIKAARTVRDLWSGSYLLSYLTYQAMKAVAEEAGAEAIVFPSLTELPLRKWDNKRLSEGEKDQVLEPCIPNRFLAEVPNDKKPVELAEAAERECRKAWSEIAEDVRTFLFDSHPHESFARDRNRKNLWYQQTETFFEIYTAVLPQDQYDKDRITKLLGTASEKEWSDRHQIAQKMLAAVKNMRHFPKYAPGFSDDKVPQKDTLLGTLEHVGPGERREANEFWEQAASKWHKYGSKVTRRERLRAVSLVKRFAWAHYFAEKFGYEDRRKLKFQDSATVAAEKWLAEGDASDPRECLKSEEHRKKKTLWSGQWLHWPTQEPPKDDLDEAPIPEDVWNAILAKKSKRGKPPTYYVVFVFDGDKMGDRFKAAKNPRTYGTISRTLGHFALHGIKDIVENHHHGKLIYAGGDDAICVLPTETALACVKAVNDAFRANWDDGIKPIVNELPEDLRDATISGGLVVAHYKEDLRFVMEEARKAEKRAKDAGRNALTITVCRRSGEHTSASLPWGFVPTVSEWVNGFLAKASDRWAYKLRGDLPVIGEDSETFKLELGRQLNRAEEITRKHFPPSDLQTAFDGCPGTVERFVTLLQTASFLARGRDA